MQINPEHMPHFTQTNKNSFKKSGMIVGLAYVTIFISVVYLFYFFFSRNIKTLFEMIFWVLTPPMFISIFIPITISIFAVSVLRSKNENEYKITKGFLITGIFITLLVLYRYGFPI